MFRLGGSVPGSANLRGPDDQQICETSQMLVLSRKVNEQIVIGDDIIVTVVAIRGTHVRLGIEAPPNVSVHRREVYEMMRQSEAKKAQTASKPAEQHAENPSQA